MGASSSKVSDSLGKSSANVSDSLGKSSANVSDSLRKSSANLKSHIIVGLSKGGEFVPNTSLEPYNDVQMRAVTVKRYLDPMKAQGYGFGHEFLVVDLRTPDDDQILIRAEKQFVDLNHEKPGGRIEVTRIEDPPKFRNDHKDRVKYEVDLQDSGNISMEDLKGILRACDQRYSLWKYNCWKYAYDALKNLLEKFAKLEDTSDYRKEKIREALEKMPPPTLPVEVLVDAGGTLLSWLVCVPIVYCEAVGGVAAGKYLWGLKMALAAGTTVKGLAGSSLLKSSETIDALAKKPWVRSVYAACCFLVPLNVSLKGFDMMKEKHYVPRQRDYNSKEFRL